MGTKAFCIVCCIMTLSCARIASTIDPCFTPGGNCLSTVIDEIGKAKSEILVQAYSLSAKPIADALIKAKESGVKVEIILDKGAGVAHNNAVYFSKLNGIATYLDGRHAVANNNVIIIDQKTVIAGSFKYTKEAEDRNAENVMIVNASGVAGSYRDNWEQHKAHAELFNAGPVAQNQAQQETRTEKKNLKKKKKTN